MNENEVMEEVVNETVEMTEKSGIGTGLALLIGGGITLAAMAGIKSLRKLCTRHGSKKVKDCVIEVVDADENDSEFIEDNEE